jgi:hypothetical protein
MPAILNSNAIIMCDHGGMVELIPKQFQVSIEGGFVLCDPDLVGAPITGCSQPATSYTAPCTLVVETLPGSSSPNIIVAGRPAYIETLTGVTNGSPPGTISVVFPGQAIAEGA